LTPRVTEEQYNQTHKEILKAATMLFSQKGYDGTSMNDIVKESGVSKGAIYSHFENKESLFEELLENQTAIDIDQLKFLFTPKDSALQKLENIAIAQFNNTCDVPEEDCRKQMEFIITASRRDPLRDKFAKQYATIHKFIADLIKEGIKNGEFRPNIDVDSVVSILIATLNGLSLLWIAMGVDLDFEKVKNSFLTLVRKGILIDNKDVE